MNREKSRDASSAVSLSNVSRRKLLFAAVPGGVVLAMPPFLASCGGGGGGGSAAAPTPSPAPVPAPAPAPAPSPAGIAMTPATTEALPGGTVTVAVAATAPAGATLAYHWSLGGNLLAIMSESPAGPGVHAGTSFDSTHSAVDVEISPFTALGTTVTLTVEAFAVVGATKTSLGIAQSLISVKNPDEWIDPPYATVEMRSGTATFALKASVPLGQTGLPLQYVWTCPGIAGTLTDGAQSTTPSSDPAGTKAFTSLKDTVTFNTRSDLVGGETETISCTVFYETKDTPPQVVHVGGQVTAEVQVKQHFNITLSPRKCTAPTNRDIPLTASINEGLPAGSTVTWSWLGGGVGTTTPAGGDANSRTSQAIVRSAVEGSAFATVSAVVTLPTGETYQVLAKSAQVDLKNNLVTVVMHPEFGIYDCSDTKACGVPQYGAFVVPIVAKATLYTAVFSGFGFGPCNRTISWTAPVPDGGGCSFPITYHPHNSVGPTPQWAVWLGFGSPIDATGQCEVTITLAP